MTIYIYIDIVMSVIEEISKLSKNGCDGDVLLNYIYENHDELECELNGAEYENHDELECELNGDEYENHDELECELNGDEYEAPEKHKT